jgi:hypothetical protein
MQGKNLEKAKYIFMPNQNNFCGMAFAKLFALSLDATRVYEKRGPADRP